MGFLSNLFGGNKEHKALREAMAHIHRILDDEAFQLELVHPVMKAMLESAPAYDKDPNRPLAHKAKLELVKSRLSSFQSQ